MLSQIRVSAISHPGRHAGFETQRSHDASQQLFDATLQDHDVRRFLDRMVIPRLKVASFQTRPHDLTRLLDESIRYFLISFAKAGERFIDLCHQCGDLSQPCEMRVADQQGQ